jgi:radical SAM superfamily enzyme YgiQ (UPF0313 family)
MTTDIERGDVMKKPKLLIIVLFQNLGDDHPYYARNPAPPLPGILLAGMTPPVVDIEVLHEMVRPIDYSTHADFIALSFLDYLFPHACEVAARFRSAGKIVVAGGKFATTHPDEVQPHFDAILVGEAQGVWPGMVIDMVAGTLRPRYTAPADGSLEAIPPPRYDLVEKKFSVPVVVEASRGCPHPCTYCALNIKRGSYRTRPVDDVIADLRSTHSLPWYRRKLAMILDNNLGGDLKFAKDLLREVARLDFWGIGAQFSIECLRDDDFVELLSAARCRMAFIGMESLNEPSLESVRKRQNRVGEYRELFDKLHRRGILTFTGLMFGLEGDTVEYYETLPDRLREVGASVILPSISIPIYGTPWYHQVAAAGRITDTDLSHYEGDHLVFHHPTLSPAEIHGAYERVNRLFFSGGAIVRRWWKFISRQEKTGPLPAFLLRLAVCTAIYFQLSVFQRHHAQVRVLSKAGKQAGRHAQGTVIPAPAPSRTREVGNCAATVRAETIS